MRSKKRKLIECNGKSMLIILALALVTCLFAFRGYIFGNSYLVFDDIGSDTAQQYIAQYSSIINHIREGNFSLWDYDYGFGCSFYVLNLFNPVLMILYGVISVVGLEHLLSAIVFLFIAEILAASVAVYLYLSAFNLGENAKIVASYVYAFNGFMIIWGQHYQFGVVCILFPLLLLGVERMLKDSHSWRFLAIISAVVTFNSMYIAYMMFLTCGFYVIIRFLMKDGQKVKSFFKGVFESAGAIILGLAMGALSLLPSVALILNVSSRVQNDGSSFIARFIENMRLYDIQFYKSLFIRMLSGTAQGINLEYTGYMNYYEGPHIFFSSILIIVFALYLFILQRQKVSVKSKVFQYLMVVMAIIMLSIPAVGVMYNGFVGQFSRYMFIIMPYFALVMAIVLNEIMEGHVIKKGISVVVVSIFGMLTTAAYIIIFLYFPFANRINILILGVTTVILAFLMICLILNGNGRAVKTKSRKTMLTALFITAIVVNITSETSSSFVRREAIEKGSNYDALMLDADTIDAIKYIDDIDDGIYRVEKTYGATLCMDSMIQDYGSVSSYNSTQNGNIINYVNSEWPELIYSDANHYMFDQDKPREDESDLAGVKYILTKENEPVPGGYDYLETVGTVDIYQSDDVTGIASFYGENEKEFEFSERLKEAKIECVEDDDDSLFEINVDTDKSGILYVALPYENGWSAEIDGSQTQIIKVNEGFQGIRMSSGNHNIKITYSCPGVMPGLIVSSLGLVLFVIFAILFRKKKGR